MGDTGAETLLEPFVRGTNISDTPGSGLGLAIVAQLLDRMGSRLEAQDSSRGMGSRFSFEIEVPLADEHDVEPDLAMGQDPVAVEGHGRTVIVAEADAARRAVLCDLLDGYGFQSVPVDSMRGLDGLEATLPVLIIAEHRWPGQEEGAVIAQLSKRLPGIPVLMFTAVPPAPADASHFTTAEMLLKPSDAAEVMARVARMIDPSDGQSHPAPFAPARPASPPAKDGRPA